MSARHRWIRLIAWGAGLAIAASGASCAEDDEQTAVVPNGMLLSQAGLFADVARGTLAEGVRAYRPRFELWSDGADKSRWLYVPEGTTIDTTDVDAWVFPVGTRAFKEFTRDGVRVETRMLEKTGPRTWRAAAFVWRADQSDADATTAGSSNTLGTPHDVPTSEQCGDCHDGAADTLLGVDAIQLAYDGDGLTTAALMADGLASAPIPERIELPGDETTAGALGYLHANCGNCHNDGARNPLRLRLTVGSLARAEDTPVYQTAVGQPTRSDPLGGTDALCIVDAGVPEQSLLYLRMTRRGSSSGMMPPLGTEDVDPNAERLIGDWIRSLL